jgi:hypothetical protein
MRRSAFIRWSKDKQHNSAAWRPLAWSAQLGFLTVGTDGDKPNCNLQRSRYKARLAQCWAKPAFSSEGVVTQQQWTPERCTDPVVWAAGFGEIAPAQRRRQRPTSFTCAGFNLDVWHRFAPGRHGWSIAQPLSWWGWTDVNFLILNCRRAGCVEDVLCGRKVTFHRRGPSI